MCRVGQDRIYAPYMTVYFVISLPKIPYIHRVNMVLANPKYLVISLPKIPYVHRIYIWFWTTLSIYASCIER